MAKRKRNSPDQDIAAGGCTGIGALVLVIIIIIIACNFCAAIKGAA